MISSENIRTRRRRSNACMRAWRPLAYTHFISGGIKKEREKKWLCVAPGKVPGDDLRWWNECCCLWSHLRKEEKRENKRPEKEAIHARGIALLHDRLISDIIPWIFDLAKAFSCGQSRLIYHVNPAHSASFFCPLFVSDAGAKKWNAREAEKHLMPGYGLDIGARESI